MVNGQDENGARAGGECGQALRGGEAVGGDVEGQAGDREGTAILDDEVHLVFGGVEVVAGNGRVDAGGIVATHGPP